MWIMSSSPSSDEFQAWVAQAIRAEAAARGMSVRQLGLKAGVADKVLRRALDCERPFHLPQLTRVAAALDVSLTFLMTEAERRQNLATPSQRAAAIIESDMSLTREQKRRLLGDAGDAAHGIQSPTTGPTTRAGDHAE